MKLEWRPVADADRDNIAEYVARDNPRAAQELDNLFDGKAELARANPTLYRGGREKGTRELVVHPHYVMVYKIDEKNKTVVILRILHTARQFPKIS